MPNKDLHAQFAGLAPKAAVTRLASLHATSEDDALAALQQLNDLYRQARPAITDATWDALYAWAESRFSDAAWEVLSAAGGNDCVAAEDLEEESQAGKIAPLPGAQRLSVLREVELTAYMSSRTKAKPTNGILAKLVDKHRRQGMTEWVVAAKLDGIALQLDYRAGKLVRAATQGKDGYFGTDVTHVVRHCPKVPVKLPQPVTLTVRCEAIFPRARQAALEKLSGKPVALRNCAGGSIRRLQADERLLHLHVVALQILDDSESGLVYSEQLEWLEELGFITPEWDIVQASTLTTSYLSNAFRSVREDDSPYDADGLVLSANVVPPQETGGNPDDWSVAYKEADTTLLVETVVTEVRWNSTKGGRWSPTIHVEPVTVGGVLVGKVSGVNGFFIEHGYTREEAEAAKSGGHALEAKPINTGAVVWLERSGDVVPNVAVVVRGAEKGATPPGAWRSDGTFYLVVDGDEEATLTRLVNQVCHSLKVLGFKGWGKALVRDAVATWAQEGRTLDLCHWHAFMVDCLVSDPAETWRAWLAAMPRKRELVVQQVRLLQQLLHNASFEQWLVASGIFQGVAATTARALKDALQAVEPEAELWHWDDRYTNTLKATAGFGPETVALLHSGWATWIQLLDDTAVAADEAAAGLPVFMGGDPVVTTGEQAAASPFTEETQARLLEGDMPLQGLFYLSGVRLPLLVAALEYAGMSEQKSFNAKKVDLLLYRSADDKGVQKKLDVTDADKTRTVAAFLDDHAQVFTPAFITRVKNLL